MFATPGRDAKTIEGFAAHLSQHQGTPEQVASVSIDMSPGSVRNFVFKAYDAPQEKICLANPRPHR
ncbi:hypothetical protein [Paraburkholderia sp. NMBU_R16]|uniref:hypothetical protein n=1 Tax=Paraburkholderia sp. NMBU_R16 TaxID=2698676 RepID=UPI00349F8B13